MEKIVIQYASAVEQYLNDLVDILFYEDYFSCEKSALAYVKKIVDAVELNIIIQKYKQTPNELAAYGEFYISYKAAKRTTWYIFFSLRGNKCLVKYITNNHTSKASFLKHL